MKMDILPRTTVEFLEVKEFLKNSQVILDVRSPKEFQAGHIRKAKNLPLFTDEERHEVGLCYRRDGPQMAFLKGLSYVAPKMTNIVETVWELCGKRGKVFLYCARGGQRSQSVGWLLEKANLEVFLLKKGYKAFRQFVLSELNKERKFLVLGGYTGSGKTKILQVLAQRGWPVLDLESIAHHRGSAFGHLGLDIQPTPMQWENNLALKLFSLPEEKTILVEDESRLVGKLVIPPKIWQSMRQAKLIFLEVPIEERLYAIVEEYGKYHAAQLIFSFKQIAKRLGLENTKEAILAVEGGDLKKAALISLSYYDKAYQYGLQKRRPESVVFIKEDTFEKRLFAIESILQNLEFSEAFYV